MNEEEKFGLWMNLSRVRLQFADAVAKGLSIHSGPSILPREYYDAIALCPEEVDELMDETNALRRQARMEAKAGFGS